MNKIEFDKCEPTVENFWKNMKTIDTYYDLGLTMMLIEAYFSLEENKGKSGRDLEIEIREHNLNMGLIAVKNSYNPTIQGLLDSGEGIIVNRKKAKEYYQLNKENKKIDESYFHSDYHMIYSCRPRDSVIKETLEHHRTLRDNLELLDDAGFMVKKSEVQNSGIKEFSDVQKSVAELLSEGKKLLKVVEISLEESFQCTIKSNPDAKVVPIGGFNDGSKIMGIVNSTGIISHVAMLIETNESGHESRKYIKIGNNQS